MRYKVPQNIDIQDRIIGPLTMLQFLYAIVGGGLSYTIFMSVAKPLSYILLVPVIALTVALALVKVNERPFLDFLLAALQFVFAPKKRIWHHKGSDNLKVVIYSNNGEENANAAKGKHISHSRIEELAKQLDTQ